MSRFSPHVLHFFVLCQEHPFQLCEFLLVGDVFCCVAGKAISSCRKMEEDDVGESGNGHGQDDQAWQTAGDEDFHLHTLALALLSHYFSSVLQAAKNWKLKHPGLTF